MPTLLTFGSLKASEVPGFVGVCPDSDQFREYVNKSTRMLMQRGSFFGTVEKLKVCVYNSCIVWPRYVGTVLAVNICRNPTQVFNNWYEFMPLSQHDFGAGGFGFSNGSCYGNTKTINDTLSPVFNPIACGAPMYVRAYPSTQQDLGKTTRIFGVDENGQTIRTQNTDGTWSEGVELTLALPYISTSFKVREVTRIIKQETQGVLRYYQYDAANDVLLDLVWLEPTELNPMYRKSKLPGKCGPSGCAFRSVEALVKLEFIPVKYDTDLVQISNIDALQDMCLSVKNSVAGDAGLAKDFEAKAIREENLALENKMPQEQIPVSINPFGSALPYYAGVGRII